MQTTLFELFTALQDVAGPDDDVLVVAAVANLLQSGRIRFLHNGQSALMNALSPSDKTDF